MVASEQQLESQPLPFSQLMEHALWRSEILPNKLCRSEDMGHHGLWGDKWMPRGSVIMPRLAGVLGLA